jgi:hypothetical protein
MKMNKSQHEFGFFNLLCSLRALFCAARFNEIKSWLQFASNAKKTKNKRAKVLQLQLELLLVEAPCSRKQSATGARL